LKRQSEFALLDRQLALAFCSSDIVVDKLSSQKVARMQAALEMGDASLW
jgi:hypothetical protein